MNTTKFFSRLIKGAAIVAGLLLAWYAPVVLIDAWDSDCWQIDQSARSSQGLPLQTFDQWKAEQIKKAGEK